MTKFLTITVEPTEDALRNAWAAAGAGRGVNEVRPAEDEMRALKRRMTIRQRIHVDRAREWIAAMREQGRVVVGVEVATPPIV
jgi:hypothetical protein